MEKLYVQHEGKVINTDSTYKHVMALALDPRDNYKEGVLRCITSRKGDVSTRGFVDRSQLSLVKGNSLEHFSIIEKLEIRNEDVVINELRKKANLSSKGVGLDFLGFEDPDIWIDKEKDLMHLYFTMPFIDHGVMEKGTKIHLGHAVGHDLKSLAMTEPVLEHDNIGGAKELSIAPKNSHGFRYNLVESSIVEKDFTYSTVRVAIAHDMGKPWQFGETVFHPKEHNIPWIGGHASPGPLFSKNFIDVGEGKFLGIMNGREANQKIDGKTKYGMFSVGLFIYDYENGKIDWVSPKPFIVDTEAKTITFASQFVETGKGEGILYAHVDDSFVRAYSLSAEKIQSFLK